MKTENLNISAGDGSGSQKCAPFVSMYTDCTKENICEGCNKCSCTADGQWVCERHSDCTGQETGLEETVTDQKIDSAMAWLLEETTQRERENSKNRIVPNLESQLPDTVLDLQSLTTESGSSIIEEEDELLSLLRDKRSLDTKDSNEEKGNGTVIFHHTVDEVNEDTLKNVNISGTLPASKIEILPKASRRSSLSNNSTSKSLQIDFTPPVNNEHAADNKVDTQAIHDDQEDLLVHHKVYEIIRNQSQATRDKELSKILVNELKGGESEIIGDKNSSIISNITFTSENDTLTAIAFIAGNLLNKIWNMEKDSSDSLETENLKHKKINDLLELFKEPLNLRQETFLKNALEHLSTVIGNKDTENISLCENIEELKRTSGLTRELDKGKSQKRDNLTTIEKDTISEIDTTQEINVSPEKDTINEKKVPKLNQKAAIAVALSKINNVLDLIKKYDNVQNSLSNLKSKTSVKPSEATSINKKITEDEKTTLNVFGNILETLTKLLIPDKKNKKIIKSVKNKKMFSIDNKVRGQFKNLNLKDMTLTTKDKLVLDYLNLIKNSPNCAFNKPREKVSPLNIEGDILLNLSEFFKIKSMSDLLKLVSTEKPKEKPLVDTKLNATETMTNEDYQTMEAQSTGQVNVSRFETTKEKLKSHLKTILEDLIELQSISGKSTRKTIEIAEALPCIYNLLNNNNKSLNNAAETKTLPKTDKPNVSVDHQVNKITKAFNNLKRELKRTLQTRRSNIGIESMPKSAVVWERAINNLNKRHKLKTRRNSQGKVNLSKLKSFESVKKIIDQIDDSSSNVYKSIAFLTEVPAPERLLLLKTLAVDNKKYISVLEDIEKSIEANNNLQIDQQKVISEFIDNVNLNVNLSEKIMNNLNKPKNSTALLNQKVRPTAKRYKVLKDLKTAEFGGNKLTLSRSQILNQIIKNRMQYYLKMKEATGDVKGSINRDLAKKILLYMEIGNDNLARELFKLFIAQNKKKPQNAFGSQYPVPVKYETMNRESVEKLPVQFPEPLIRFEEPKVINKEMSWLNQEQLLRQLANIKNMEA